MKYQITFYTAKRTEFEAPMPVLTKKETDFDGLWHDSLELYTLEEAYSILKGSGYVFAGIDADGWHKFNYDGILKATLVPEHDVDVEI